MHIRCHKLGLLMTEPKLKADKEAGNLSETAKSYLRDIWLQNEYGYKEPSTPSIEMLKGLMCEADSMSLVQDTLKGQFRTKNLETFKQEGLAGTPDIILADCVEDIKTSWSLRTFYEADEDNSVYFWQAVGYMMLTGVKAYRLIYCLVPTPEELIQREIDKLSYAYGRNSLNPNYLKAVEQIKHNNDLITKLPNEKRIKVFNFALTEADTDKVNAKLKKAQEFYNTITLN
jgi:hypothetical protein